MMTGKTLSLAASIAAALLLSACGGSEEAPETEATADAGPQGEVRGGTISDAMLPLDSVKSQSPQRGGDDDDDAADDASPDASQDGGDAG